MLYTIVLHTNEEEHTVPLEALESTTGLALRKEEAVLDQEVVWLHKGKTPYKATIVGSQSCNVGRGSAQRSQGVKSGGVKTAKKAVLGDEVSDDDKSKENSIPPSDMSDEEQGDLIACACVLTLFILHRLNYRADY